MKDLDEQEGDDDDGVAEEFTKDFDDFCEKVFGKEEAVKIKIVAESFRPGLEAFFAEAEEFAKNIKENKL